MAPSSIPAPNAGASVGELLTNDRLKRQARSSLQRMRIEEARKVLAEADKKAAEEKAAEDKKAAEEKAAAEKKKKDEEKDSSKEEEAREVKIFSRPAIAGYFSTCADWDSGISAA